MNRVAIGASTAASALPATVPQPRLLLLGTGTVGSAFVERWQQLARRGLALPRFGALANSRGVIRCGEEAGEALRAANRAPRDAAATNFWQNGHGCDALVADPIVAVAAPMGDFASPRPFDIIVDATASDAIAARHAPWLARGVHVVTANKLGTGADLLRAQAVARARSDGNSRYGDAATVGAGLPLLRSIRELHAGGDRIHAIAGVLSGSLAWLFDRYDGRQPFADLVRTARDGGYTEPDPREDLSGEDVRRKLLILARTAGIALEAHEVAVESLLTPELAAAAPEEVDATLSTLDAPLRRLHAEACDQDARLRFMARFRYDGDGRIRATVGPEALGPTDPFASSGGTDNRVAIWSDRYRDQPLVVQGPGAGAGVTAAALLDDVLRVVAAG